MDLPCARHRAKHFINTPSFKPHDQLMTWYHFYTHSTQIKALIWKSEAASLKLQLKLDPRSVDSRGQTLVFPI